MSGRVALITGSTRGIGLGIARALAADGYTLALNGVRPADQVQPVLDEFRDKGVEAAYFRADISRADDRRALMHGVIEHFGRLDVLVNNAGVGPMERRDILNATEESFRRLIDTNLVGPHFLTQLVAQRMVEAVRTELDMADPQPRHRFVIVFVTSVSAEAASTNRGEYCVSKAGLSMAARLWAVKLAEFGIPVYEVRPGIIRTDMTAGVRENYDRMIAGGVTLEPRWGTPEDVGRVVATLVRGDMPYSTGAIVHVDGGLTVPRL